MYPQEFVKGRFVPDEWFRIYANSTAASWGLNEDMAYNCDKLGVALWRCGSRLSNCMSSTKTQESFLLIFQL